GIVALPNVIRRQGVVADLVYHMGRLASHPFPLTQVHDLVVHLFEFRVVRREPGMKPFIGVVVGIYAGIVGGKLFHLVKAMLDRIGIGFVAHMPLTGEVRRVAVFLEKFGDRRRLLVEEVLVTRGNYDRERRADRNTPGHERGAAGGATRLTVPAGNHCTLLRYAIDTRCGMSAPRASARIAAEIIPTSIVSHQHYDV